MLFNPSQGKDFILFKSTENPFLNFFLLSPAQSYWQGEKSIFDNDPDWNGHLLVGFSTFLNFEL